MPRIATLSRKRANREHLLRNLATSIILYERVDTTRAKAHAVKGLVDRWISTAKQNTLHARRQLLGEVFNDLAVKKMFDILVPRYEARLSGFSRTVSLGQRLGDGAEVVRVELMDRNVVPTVDAPKPPRTTKKIATKATEKTNEKSTK